MVLGTHQGWTFSDGAGVVSDGFQDTKNLQPKMIQPRRGMLLDRSRHRSDGNDLSRRELERQIQELRRDKVRGCPGCRYGGSADVCWSVARKSWRQNHVKSLGKYEI